MSAGAIPAPALLLPALPTAAAERVALLERLATEIVRQLGAPAAAALAAWIDEAAADTPAGDARA
jgi:hypothetical protein